MSLRLLCRFCYTFLYISTTTLSKKVGQYASDQVESILAGIISLTQLKLEEIFFQRKEQELNHYKTERTGNISL